MPDRMKKKTNREVTITGFIEEIELEDGETGLQLDDGDQVYLVTMDKIGRKLQHHIDEEVDVTGLITQTSGDREIKVNRFRLTDDYYDDDDERYDDDEEGYYDEDDD